MASGGLVVDMGRLAAVGRLALISDPTADSANAGQEQVVVGGLDSNAWVAGPDRDLVDAVEPAGRNPLRPIFGE